MALMFTVMLPVLAAIILITAVFFIGRAFIRRSQRDRQPYGVGQQEIRRAMHVDFVRGLVAAVVGLVVLLAMGFGNWVLPMLPSPVPTEVVDVAPDPNGSGGDVESPPTVTPTLTAVSPTITPTPLPAMPTVTPTVVTTPTPTPQPEPETAVVQSGVGVWLRSAPSPDSEQLEWLLDGTVLALLPGYQVGEQFEWQEVAAPSGQEGWVAVDFIIYDTDLPDEPDPENDEDSDNGNGNDSSGSNAELGHLGRRSF